MRRLLYFITGALLLAACSKHISGTQIFAGRVQFRITGYMLRSDIATGKADTYDFSKINYLNIAFLNPDTSGVFKIDDRLNKVIQKAHNHHVKVFASIGGGLAPAYYSSLLTSGNRQALIKNLVRLTTSLNLEGIDVDLEGERIDTNYEDFVTSLATKLRLKNKVLTAAVATVYGNRYTDKALRQFDYINIMSYDKTGPWRPEQPGQHAPYAMALADIDYWTLNRRLPKDKLSLGLPFYGYGFGRGAPEDMSYKDLVKNYPEAEYKDSVIIAAGGIIYYNGLPTIREKVRLAKQKTGGVMIWELMQDTSGSKSLLNAINAVISAK